MCSRVPLGSRKFYKFSVVFWLRGLLANSPLVAFRDLLADPLPTPNWLRGFWMAPYKMFILIMKFEKYVNSFNKKIFIIDISTDYFSFKIILFQIITGKLPQIKKHWIK